jgi:putative oxidoreductase
MAKFSFLTTPQAIIILRIVTGLIFVAHAAVRVIGSTVDRFGGFLDTKGFAFGVLIVWILTVYEIAAGLLLALGIFTRWLALGFIIIIVTGIIIIHAANGWFVGEHGTGGMEYSIILIASLLVIAAADKK